MEIVIIEDEPLTAADLAESITRSHPSSKITAMLNSVRTAIDWFSTNQSPDLIFCDIQLGDGLSFDIFKAVPMDVPVIFCTAYDRFALQAFEANGIDYILKPFDHSSIAAAMTKYFKLRDKFNRNPLAISEVIALFESRKKQESGSILVYFKDRIVPVRYSDIALFYIHNETTFLLTRDQRRYSVNRSLDEIEQSVPSDFFRVNRQYIVHRQTIRDASRYFAHKLSLSLTIPFQETITVSKLKVPPFLKWLSAR
jgi:two-component system, LytTR family, response regulator LytT